MRKLIVVVLFFIGNIYVNAQESMDISNGSNDSIQNVDLKYREDQFYFGLTHTLMQDKPGGYTPNSISLGVNGGFLRDFPVNAKRTMAIAPGVGYSYVNLRGNLGLTPEHEHIILDSYKKSSVSLHAIDFPLELRWRNSTPYSHKFWRVHLGFKASYVFNNRSKTNSGEYTTTMRGDEDINKWLYGLYMSAGFNTWNFYMYYGLNNVYKENVIKEDSNKFRLLNVGVMFYIL